MFNEKLRLFVKKAIFGDKETYAFGDSTLLFKFGSRPIRRRYINSSSDVVRNDVLQINFFEKNFKSDDVLWDIGSHHGHYSLFAASVVTGEKQVYSFEPDSIARKIQVENINLNRFGSKITLSHAAVGRTTGILKFREMGGNANSHIFNESESETSNIVEVESVTLNSLIGGLPKPSIIKIDTEGAEIDILSSATELIHDPSITFICELHPFAWSSYGVNYKQFESLLKDCGRNLQLLDPLKKVSDLPYYGTVIF